MERNKRRKYGRCRRHRFGNPCRWICNWCGYWSLILLLPCTALGHGGGLDASGGHNSKSGYHFHRSSYTPPAKPSSFGYSYRSSANTSARTTAPTHNYRERIRSDKEDRASILASRIEQDAEAEKRAHEAEARRVLEAKQEMRAQASAAYHRLAPRFTLHHDTLHPYEAVDLLDNDEYWRILLSKGWFLNLDKKHIVRVEPIECPTDYRTWVDASGQFSIVAKLGKIKKPYVQLVSITGRTHAVNADKLSDVDRRFLTSLLHGITTMKPKYFKGTRLDQVAKVYRFCIFEGRASAEVEKTTRGNRILDDNQWKYPKKIAISQFGTIESLIADAFPSDVWTEIERAEYDKLEFSYR